MFSSPKVFKVHNADGAQVKTLVEMIQKKNLLLL